MFSSVLIGSMSHSTSNLGTVSWK